MPESAIEPTFAELFGLPSDVRGEAPGRVNLLGEHTDYHDGFVLPCAIPQRTRVELRRRRDQRVRVWSAAYPESVMEFTAGAEARSGEWMDYVAGVTFALRRAGSPVGGFDARIESDVPAGAGLSSSASLEVAVLRGLRTMFDLVLDDLALAEIGRAAEVDFVGAPVGIMDQMAASLGTEREALFLDTRSLAYSLVPLPPSIDLVVISSGVAHQHASGAYAARRAESEEAARRLGVARLRDVPAEALERVDALPPLLARRARHIVTENGRVLAAVEALREGNTTRLADLFAASHASMRDDYEVSTPEIDVLVDIGRSDPDIWGARLTGGGFGGSVVMVARAGAALAAAARIATKYAAASGRGPRVLVPS